MSETLMEAGIVGFWRRMFSQKNDQCKGPVTRAL